MRKRLFWLLLLLLALASAFLLLRSHSLPKHIFLITLDTMRADAIDYRMNGLSATPNLAALAAAGVRFDNAYSITPITLPSHAAMFYSLPPHVLKILNNGQERSIPYLSLAEIMKKNGYASGAVISLAVLKREFGLEKGFDHYLENFRPNLWYRSAAEVNRDAFTLIERLKNGKSFVWLHYSDTHEPYFPPGQSERFAILFRGKTLFSGPSIEQPMVRVPLLLQPGANTVLLETEIPALAVNGFSGIAFSNFRIEETKPGVEIGLTPSPDLLRHEDQFDTITLHTTAVRSSLKLTLAGKNACQIFLSFKYQLKTDDATMRANYRREARYLDEQIGLLVAYLNNAGIYKSSAFLVMGDHGEGLGEYKGHFGHIHFLNKVYCHVPFFVSGHDVRREGVRHDLVSNFNVAPTLLALTGARKKTYMIGSDVMKGRGDPNLLLATYSPEAYFDSFALIRFPLQVIFQPGKTEHTMEFYDLATDPFGTSDISSNDDPSGKRPEMERAVLNLARTITAHKHIRITKKNLTIEKLKALGYL
jgi:arylsulfatase A-like enzyme